MKLIICLRRFPTCLFRTGKDTPILALIIIVYRDGVSHAFTSPLGKTPKYGSAGNMAQEMLEINFVSLSFIDDSHKYPSKQA